MNIMIFVSFFPLWLCWVFAAALELSLAVESGGYSPVVVHGLLLLQGTGFRQTTYFSSCGPLA